MSLPGIRNQAMCELTNKQFMYTMVVFGILMQFLSASVWHLVISRHAVCVCVCVCACARAFSCWYSNSFDWNKNNVVQRTFPLRVETCFTRCDSWWQYVSVLTHTIRFLAIHQLLTWAGVLFYAISVLKFSFRHRVIRSRVDIYDMSLGIFLCANWDPQGQTANQFDITKVSSLHAAMPLSQ
jgi:hypothetical protein